MSSRGAVTIASILDSCPECCFGPDRGRPRIRRSPTSLRRRFASLAFSRQRTWTAVPLTSSMIKPHLPLSLVMVLTSVAALAWGCSSRHVAAGRRVVVLGIDGMDYQLVRDLMA